MLTIKRTCKNKYFIEALASSIPSGTFFCVNIAITHNKIMHDFSRIEYYLSNQLIEALNYPGQATTMLGLLKYQDLLFKCSGSQ